MFLSMDEPGLKQRVLALLLLGIAYLCLLLGSWSEALRPLLLAGATLGMAVLVWAWKTDRFSLRWILVAGILLRLAFMPLPPSLSTDAYRYFWDGWLGLNGINPFQFAPSDPALAEFQELEVYGQFNSPDYYSVYPPVMQLFFLFAAWVGQLGFFWGYLALKLALGCCELGALWVLAKWLPPRQVLLYAWNPLVIVETWGQPHGEAIVLGALAGCLWFLRARPMLSVACLTIATWAKLWPVLLFPFLFHKLRWHWRHFLVAGGVTLLLWLPYASAATFRNLGESLRLYTHLLEWNGGLYEALKLIRWSITNLLWALGMPEEMGHGRITAPFLRICLFLSVLLVFWRGRNWPLVRPFALISVFAVLSLSTVHPWYLLPICWLLPFFSRVEWSWLLLSLCSLGTYLAYTMGAAAYWPFVILGWGGWIAVLFWQWRRDQSPPFSDPLTVERP